MTVDEKEIKQQIEFKAVGMYRFSPPALTRGWSDLTDAEKQPWLEAAAQPPPSRPSDFDEVEVQAEKSYTKQFSSETGAPSWHEADETARELWRSTVRKPPPSRPSDFDRVEAIAKKSYENQCGAFAIGAAWHQIDDLAREKWRAEVRKQDMKDVGVITQDEIDESDRRARDPVKPVPGTLGHYATEVVWCPYCHARPGVQCTGVEIGRPRTPGSIPPTTHDERVKMYRQPNDDLLTEVGTLAMKLFELFETEIPPQDRTPWVELPDNIKEGWRESARKKIARQYREKNFVIESDDHPVNHPSHYGGDTVYEAIKVIRAWNLGFSLGNAVKYISRAGKKDPAKHIEDLRKAQWYLDEEIRTLEAARK